MSSGCTYLRTYAIYGGTRTSVATLLCALSKCIRCGKGGMQQQIELNTKYVYL